MYDLYVTRDANLIDDEEEEVETYMMGDDRCKEEEMSPEISTDPGDTRDPQRNVKSEEEEEEIHVIIKEEEDPIEISTDTRDVKDGDPQIDVKNEEEEEIRQVKIEEEEILVEVGTGELITQKTINKISANTRQLR
ncbi:uncharacterized protein ACMZJ9_015095 [Mantella aurantiaca]